MLSKLLEIPCPVIAAVHGRAHIHSELLLFSDVIIADDSASFRDLHIPMGVVAGDGVHIAYPLAFGMNRGRRILLTGEIVTARQALDWGAIAEIVPPDELLPRAWELAERLSQLPILALRYSREVITREIARQLHDNLGFGLALEGFGSGLGAWPRPPGK
jgi:enoyl-CoA hydratase/carnithine racemase